MLVALSAGTLVVPHTSVRAQPAPGAAADPDSAIEAYLSSLGLRDLLVTHLERRLDAERTASEKARVAARLADLYAQMLDGAQTPEERLDLIERGRRLLAAVPDAESVDLRLGLHRASFARAEALLERVRLRLAGPEAKAEAENLLASIAPDLTRLATAAVQAVNALEAQEEGANVADEFDFSEALALARRRRSLAAYLAGWSKTYLAEFAGAPGAAADALVHFGWLLSAAPGQQATPERVPTSLLQYEHIARSVVGAAVCKSAVGRTDEAIAFLDIVEDSSDTPGAVRSELAARRMTVLASASRWLELAALVEDLRTPADAPRAAPPTPLPTGEARLLAVLTLAALEGPELAAPAAQSRRAAVQLMAESALADLVTRDELAQVMDLTARFGAAAIASDAFLARHVRAVRDYESAREAHRAAAGPGAGPDDPTANSRAVDQYRRAVAQLRSAFESADAVRFPEARAADAMLIGLALFYSSGAPTAQNALTRTAQLTDAARWLENAAGLFERDPARQADALAMAVRAMDEAGAERDGAIRARRDELAARFLERFPADERAGALLIRLASAPGASPDETVALLLRVRDDSPAYEAARQRAARHLYDAFRAARPADRDWAALRYADVEQELLVLDRDRAAAGDAEAASRAIVRGRRLLDALLSVQAPDAARARAVLDIIASVSGAARVDSGGFAGELQYRRAQIALATGEEAEAERIVAELLRASGSDASYTEAAAHLLHRRAVLAWRDARRRNADGEALAWARRVVERGSTLLLSSPEGSRDDTTTDRAPRYALRASVAEAAADLWFLGRDERARTLAIDLHRALLDEEPADRAALRRLALLAEDAGDDGAALASWRRLASGLRPGSEDWFEARYRLTAILARTDPSRARDALVQHRTLWPTLGPAPWDERFAALERSLASGGKP